jgi:hypothetical protein
MYKEVIPVEEEEVQRQADLYNLVAISNKIKKYKLAVVAHT